MRQYTGRERKQLTKIVCNQCGRILKIQDGILQEGVFRGMADWGFFLRKGRRNSLFRYVRKVLDRLISGFSIPVETEEQTELL